MSYGLVTTGHFADDLFDDVVGFNIKELVCRQDGYVAYVLMSELDKVFVVTMKNILEPINLVASRSAKMMGFSTTNPARLQSIAFDDKSSTLYVISRSEIVMKNMGDRESKILHTFPYDSNYAMNILLSKDGHKLICAVNEDQKTIRIYDVSSGDPETIIKSEEIVKTEHCDGIMTLSSNDKMLYFASSPQTISVLNLESKDISIFAGIEQHYSDTSDTNGELKNATFKHISSMKMSRDGNKIFITSSSSIRVINLFSNMVYYLVENFYEEKFSTEGNMYDGYEGCVYDPKLLSLSPDGNILFFTDCYAGKYYFRWVCIDDQSAYSSSTLTSDMTQMIGNTNLPNGTASFLVGRGEKRKRFEGNVIPLLCVRSDYFNNLFKFPENRKEDGESHDQPMITMEDTDPDAFNTVLKFIATDKITLYEQHEESVKLAFSTMILASQYRMTHLEKICMRFLQEPRNLTPEQAVEVLQASYHFGDGQGNPGKNQLFNSLCNYVFTKGKVCQSYFINLQIEVLREILTYFVNQKYD